MRFTILTEQGERIVMRDDPYSHGFGYFIAQNGISGWFGSPQIREDATGVDGVDGDIAPSTLTQGARTFTLNGYVVAHSTVELAREIDRINSLVGKRLTITAEDAHGVRVAEGFLSDDPDPQVFADERNCEFALVITCPDPHRYGRWVSQTANGKVSVPNRGNVPSFPRFVVTGSPITYFTATCNGQTVSWSGSATELTLDLADMVPSIGTVSVDNAFAIPPGGAEVTVSTNGTATIYSRDGWR